MRWVCGRDAVQRNRAGARLCKVDRCAGSDVEGVPVDDQVLRCLGNLDVGAVLRDGAAACADVTARGNRIGVKRIFWADVLAFVLFKILLPDAVRLTDDSDGLADVLPLTGDADDVGVFIKVIP